MVFPMMEEENGIQIHDFCFDHEALVVQICIYPDLYYFRGLYYIKFLIG